MKKKTKGKRRGGVVLAALLSMSITMTGMPVYAEGEETVPAGEIQATADIGAGQETQKITVSISEDAEGTMAGGVAEAKQTVEKIKAHDDDEVSSAKPFSFFTIDEETGEITITNFSFVTSLKINSKNKSYIVVLGRNRWKIENKGFKEQKSDILNINHIYTKRCNGTKNLYLIIKFSHTLLNLLNYGDILIKNLITTKNEVSDLIRYSLTSSIQSLNLNRLIQLRLP